jgi:hypothetical protein
MNPLHRRDFLLASAAALAGPSIGRGGDPPARFATRGVVLIPFDRPPGIFQPVAYGRSRGLGLPYVSWISAPLNLVDTGDTLDKVQKDQLSAVAASVTEVLRFLHRLP